MYILLNITNTLRFMTMLIHNMLAQLINPASFGCLLPYPFDISQEIFSTMHTGYIYRDVFLRSSKTIFPLV